MLKELTRTELQKRFEKDPSRVFLILSHNGVLHLEKHVSRLTDGDKRVIPYKDVPLTIKKLREQFSLSETATVSKDTAADFFSHSDPHFKYVRYASINDGELKLIAERYPWDYVFVYIEPD